MQRGAASGGRALALLLLLLPISPLAGGAGGPLPALTPAERSWLDGHGPVTYLADSNFPPFAFRNPHGNLSGINIDILRLISVNLDVEFAPRSAQNFSEVLDGMRNGTADLAGNLGRNEERERFLDFTEPYAYARLSGWLRNDHPAPPADLAGMRVAAVNRTNLAASLPVAYPLATLVTVNNDTVGVEGVAEGRFDVFFGATPTIAYRVRQLGIDNLAPVITLNETRYAFAVRKGDATLLSIMEKGLASVSPEQRLAIDLKWTGTDLGPPRVPTPGVLPTEVVGVMAALALFAVLAAGWSATLKRQVAARTKDLRAQTARLEASEGRFRAVAETASDAIIYSDSQGVIRYLNPAAEKCFGYAASEAVGQPQTMLMPPGDRQAHAARLAGLLAEEGPRMPGTTIEQAGLRKDGSVFPLELSLDRWHAGDEAYVTAILRDISERKRSEQQRLAEHERENELTRLREVDRFKTRFINTASHELATPLTPIMLQLFRLQSDAHKLAPEHRNALAIIDRNAHRLTDLVQDVLDGARLQAGRMPLRLSSQDVGLLVEDAADAYRAVASSRGLVLHIEAPPRGSMASVDPGRISQVLDNLLSNAIKFTPTGGQVALRMNVQGGSVNVQGGSVEVRVSDTGIGLTPEQAGKLFQPFAQVHDTMQVTEPGTGLGLYIARGIVEQHGGRMWVESDGPGQGCTFAFSLPRADAPDPPAAETEASLPMGPGPSATAAANPPQGGTRSASTRKA